jgi:hypothetical protein
VWAVGELCRVRAVKGRSGVGGWGAVPCASSEGARMRTRAHPSSHAASTQGRTGAKRGRGASLLGGAWEEEARRRPMESLCCHASREAACRLCPCPVRSIIIVGGANQAAWALSDSTKQLLSSAGAVLLQREIPEAVNLEVSACRTRC